MSRYLVLLFLILCLTSFAQEERADSLVQMHFDAFEEDQNPDSIVNALSLLIEKYPNEPYVLRRAYTFRGVYKFYKGWQITHDRDLLKKGIEDLDTAIYIDSIYLSGVDTIELNLYYERAMYLYLIGDENIEVGLQHIIRHDTLNFRTADAYSMLGDIANRKDQHSQAMLFYTKAIELDSTNGEFYYSRANLQRNQEDIQGAIEDYTLAIKYQSDPAFALFYRGELLAEELLKTSKKRKLKCDTTPCKDFYRCIKLGNDIGYRGLAMYCKGCK